MARPNPTLNVSTVNLSADSSAADAKFGPDDRAPLPPQDLVQLLENFSRIDELENHTHEPRVKVSCPTGEFSVRLSTGKLYLYYAQDMTQPPAELDIPGLMAVFTGSEAAEDGTEEIIGDLPKAGAKWRGVLGAGALVLGLGLNGWALYAYLQPKPVWPPPLETVAVTDPGTLSLYAAQLPGTYATGSGAGQRAILISPEQGISFQLFGEGAAGTVIRESRDTYTLSKMGQSTFLVTQRFGAVEVLSDGSLSYSGDLYGREESGE